MRLIDADKLLEDIRQDKFTEYCRKMEVPLNDEPQLDGFHVGLVEGAILLQPTIKIESEG